MAVGRAPVAVDVTHMKLSELNNLLSSTLPASAFSQAIAAELAVHQSGFSARGRSAPIVVVEDHDVLVNSENVKTLCHLFVSAKAVGSKGSPLSRLR